MMKLLLLAGDCPDAAGRAKVREEGRRVGKAATLAGSDLRLAGGCHFCLWHLYIRDRGELWQAQWAQTGGGNRPHTPMDVCVHSDSIVQHGMLGIGLIPGKDLRGDLGCAALSASQRPVS